MECTSLVFSLSERGGSVSLIAKRVFCFENLGHIWYWKGKYYKKYAEVGLLAIPVVRYMTVSQQAVWSSDNTGNFAPVAPDSAASVDLKTAQHLSDMSDWCIRDLGISWCLTNLQHNTLLVEENVAGRKNIHWKLKVSRFWNLVLRQTNYIILSK